MMKRVLGIAVTTALSLGLLAGCGSSGSGSGTSAGMKSDSPQIQAIQKLGKVRAGVKVDVPKFGYKDPATGKIEGFEVDLVKAVAKKILGDENKIEVSGVNAKTRGPALDNGELDMVVATFTITEDRKKTWNFSQPYYEDAVGLLVKKDGPIKSFKDLNGKTVGVSQSSTTKVGLQAEADKIGSKLNFSEFGTYPEIKAALDAGRVDAFSVDGAILAGYVDKTTVILADRFSPQQYGVATKLDNKDLAKVVDDLIAEMKKNGEMDKILKKWGLK